MLKGPKEYLQSNKKIGLLNNLSLYVSVFFIINLSLSINSIYNIELSIILYDKR
jgi:hypothetical protein